MGDRLMRNTKPLGTSNVCEDAFTRPGLPISHETPCRRPTRGGIPPVQHDPGTRGSEPVANQEEGHEKPPPGTDVPRKRK